MRRFIIVLLAMSALNAYAQGFIDLLNPTKIADTDGSHGTFCTSIAAGSVMDDVTGTGGRPLGGIAPEADILFSDNLMSESGNEAYDMVECLYYIGNAAEMEKKPYVISISQNSHAGWHDGTSDMARFLGLPSGWRLPTTWGRN